MGTLYLSVPSRKRFVKTGGNIDTDSRFHAVVRRVGRAGPRRSGPRLPHRLKNDVEQQTRHRPSKDWGRWQITASTILERSQEQRFSADVVMCRDRGCHRRYRSHRSYG